MGEQDDDRIRFHPGAGLCTDLFEMAIDDAPVLHVRRQQAEIRGSGLRQVTRARLASGCSRATNM